MSACKHSRAPWRFDHDWQRLPTIFDADGNKVAVVEKDRIVAGKLAVDLEGRKANAKLIEAAPDLLAVVQMILDKRPTSDPEDGTSFKVYLTIEECGAISAAATKANGGAS